MVRLYHGRTSVCSVKTRLALAEKGVDWESQLLTLRGDQFDPAYLKLNPNAVVPTIVHDGPSLSNRPSSCTTSMTHFRARR
jgi:glutathione S-transferase